jgi:CDP-glucose 4,6-dehydratase
MHFLITGHTGFKGAWLTLLLASRGHKVSGLSLEPLAGSLYEKANVESDLSSDLRVDIRNRNSTIEAIKAISPDVVIHMAAQPLVRESYRDPRFTFETNVMGTLNVLEAVSETKSIKAHLVITTDKVYRNVNQIKGYLEDDPLGGDDPYSSSKAMADILTQSWVKSFPGVPTAIARAGNVIGGGDVSPERLLVDLLQNFQTGKPVEIRYPEAVRPWQHVLDCVNGYVALIEKLLQGKGQGLWNLGPGAESFVPVAQVADTAVNYWGPGASWFTSENEHFHEAGLLALDASKASTELNWQNKLKYPTSLEWTVEWQKFVSGGANVREVTLEQISRFEIL